MHATKNLKMQIQWYHCQSILQQSGRMVPLSDVEHFSLPLNHNLLGGGGCLV
jgi:hypothetical protein